MLKVGGLLLAAGRSSRITGGYHKLLAEFEGMPLVRKSAVTLLQSKLSPIAVVVGHRSQEIEDALNDLSLKILPNKDFANGLGSSLACGFSDKRLNDCDGILIMLADMPAITTEHINLLLHAFTEGGGQRVVRGANRDKPGHPVILPKAMFAAMKRLTGDGGARAIIQNGKEPIHLVDIASAALIDVDTTEAVLSAGGVIRT